MEPCGVSTAEDGDHLEAWLREHLPENVLMPLFHGTKKPMACHKATPASGGVSPWTWDAWDSKRAALVARCKTWDLAILSRTLFVIDADSQEAASYLQETYPYLDGCCSATTRKGMHFYFTRTSQCDALNIFDRVKAMKAPDGTLLPIDIKTLCATGTGAIIAVAPSTGKSWIHAPWDVAPIPLPEDLAADIASATTRHPKSESPGVARVHPPTSRLGGLHKWMLGALHDSGFDGVDIGEAREAGFYFTVPSGSSCLCCDNVHDSNRSYAIFTGCSLYVKSFSDRCRPLIIPVPAFTPFFDWESHVDERLWGPPRSVEMRYLDDLDLRSSTIACFSGCGSGKSRTLIRAMHAGAAQLGLKIEDLRVLLISTRVAFADSRGADLAHLGFQHYKTTTSELPDCTKLVCEMESLYKLRYDLPDYHMVWLDEGESIAANLSNATTMERTICECQWIFEALFRTARWVLWMDAVPTMRGLTCLQGLMRCGGRTGHIVNNTFPCQRGRRMCEVQKAEEWEELLLEKLDRGERVEVVMASKGEADRLVAKLPEGSYLYYHSKASVEAMRTLKDVNTHWSTVRAVVFTATVLNGIDYEGENFDCAMVFGSGGRGPTARDLFQMHMRVRKLRSGSVFYHFPHSGGCAPLLTPANIERNLVAQHFLGLQLRGVDVDIEDLVEASEWLRQTHILNVWETNLSRATCKEMFVRLMASAGYTSADADEEEWEAPLEVDAVATCTVAQAPCPKYEEIRRITELRAAAIKRKINKATASTADKCEYERFKFDTACRGGSPESRAAVFEACQADAAVRDKFHHILWEMRRPEASMMADDYASARVKDVTRLRALSLKAVHDMCESTGLPTSFAAGAVVQSATLAANLGAVIAARDAYFASIHERVQESRKRKCRADTAEQGAVARAKNAMNLVLRRWSGMELVRDGKHSQSFCLKAAAAVVPLIVEVLN